MFSSGVAADFKFVVDTLRADDTFPPTYTDHALAGELSGYRECHLKGDLLLIYKKHEELSIIELSDIGSHSQLFG